ncbi:winged helix-turn-helix transcriptional regulator [Brachybacterium sp. EF45031]|uniref:FeoC-like transcriptional regulator n=1 Tax=Brachybacterium sillae TaxID=2810536 RepID=UPI00217D4198|nr:FeoC-like transcriptional regulator [Brachybacterium sillae]MCS6712378.1 winged helix-turn-helix transcriptional regulator [Brachybacterium sillae]
MQTVTLGIPTRRPTGPLAKVTDALRHGSTTPAAIARTSGLSLSTVEASLDHLERMGRIDRAVMASACPTGGCGSCTLGADGGPACGTRH